MDCAGGSPAEIFDGAVADYESSLGNTQKVVEKTMPRMLRERMFHTFGRQHRRILCSTSSSASHGGGFGWVPTRIYILANLFCRSERKVRVVARAFTSWSWIRARLSRGLGIRSTEIFWNGKDGGGDAERQRDGSRGRDEMAAVDSC